jgi:hypothetical protein
LCRETPWITLKNPIMANKVGYLFFLVFLKKNPASKSHSFIMRPPSVSVLKEAAW